jgi:hypothetical protein
MSAVRLGMELMSATDFGLRMSEVEIKPCTPLPTPVAFVRLCFTTRYSLHMESKKDAGL